MLCRSPNGFCTTDTGHCTGTPDVLSCALLCIFDLRSSHVAYSPRPTYHRQCSHNQDDSGRIHDHRTKENFTNATKTFRKLKWAVIGAETGQNAGKVIPKAGWIQDILTSADAAGTPVFMRSSMENVVGVQSMRREKPQPLLQRIPSDVQKSRLWEHCTVCGKYQPMKEMYALLLRRKRGDNPERVAYMCPECYVKFSIRLHR